MRNNNSSIISSSLQIPFTYPRDIDESGGVRKEEVDRFNKNIIAFPPPNLEDTQRVLYKMNEM